MSIVYFALYKGKRKGHTLQAMLSRVFDYYCEIVIKRREWLTGHHYDHEIVYDCYSSSIRDGGVRCKQIDVNNGKWDLIPLDGVTEQQIKQYFERTKGKKYDFLGVLGVIFFIPNKRNKFFCSEWCANAITGNNEGWRFSPNHLAAIFRKK